MEEEEFDVVDFMIRYESGETTDAEFLEGFGYLIANGLAWSLQGHYGRTAAALIDAGLITRTGEVLGGLPC